MSWKQKTTFEVIDQTRGRVSPPISKHREVGWKNKAQPSFFNQWRSSIKLTNMVDFHSCFFIQQAPKTWLLSLGVSQRSSLVDDSYVPRLVARPLKLLR